MNTTSDAGTPALSVDPTQKVACPSGSCGASHLSHHSTSAPPTIADQLVVSGETRNKESKCGIGCCANDQHSIKSTPSSIHMVDKNGTTKPDNVNAPCVSGCCNDDQESIHSSSAATIETMTTNFCDENEKCDEICIKAAAALECKLACEVEEKECCAEEEENDDQAQHAHHDHDHEHPHQKTHAHQHDKDGQHVGEACTRHFMAAMERYSSYLETARCICRSVIKTANKTDKGCAPSVIFPCAPMPHGSPTTLSHRHPREHSDGTSTSHSHGKQTATVVQRHKFKKLLRADDSNAHDHSIRKDYHDNCGRDIHHDHHEPSNQHSTKFSKKEKLKSETGDADIEKDASGTHVLFNVTGMDCSGCANNLTRALNNIPGTRNAKVTFISNTAELDIDTGKTPLEEAVRLAERATGYKLVPFSADTQSLDIILDTQTAKAFQSNLPRGIETCLKVSNTVYEINYDPCLVGARDVIEFSGGKLAPPRTDSSLDAGRRRLLWVAYLTLVAFIFTMPVVVMEWGDFNTIPHNIVLIISIVLGTIVQTIAYPEFYKPAISSLIFNKVLEMDMLVVISITAAYGYSVVAAGLMLSGRSPETSPFFETSTLLITLVLFGRLLAAWARKRAVSKVSLRSLQASTAILVDPSTGGISEVDARLLQYGDRIQVQPHSQVVTDAEVTNGSSEVDESMLTGESLPILKTPGDSIISGTMNGAGTLTARVSRLPGKNTITDIANLVEQAQGSKPKIQDLADKVAGYFIPVVVTASIIVFIIWLAIALKIRHQAAGGAIGTAIGYCIAVLAVSCPCALGLAVPMVLVIAGGIAAKGGIIIKSAHVTERGHKVTDVVFDKTGTLTEGHIEVIEDHLLLLDHLHSTNDGFSLIKAMIKDNKHPVSQAVARALEKRACEPIEVRDLRSIPGCGMQGIWNNHVIRAGNSRWLGVSDHPMVLELTNKGMTLLCVTIDDGNVLAIFGLKSSLRPEAARVVRELQERKIDVHIVSGDNLKVVQGVAKNLNIDLANVAGERSPAQKQHYVQSLMDNGKTTLFCGDGTNDAVAVAQADVGVQIESSSDVTRGTADVVLLGTLDGVVALLDVSKAAYRRILFNFGWSATYNVVAILLASGAFVRIRIPPAFAGLGEIVSVLPVVIAALTMPKVKRG